MVTIAHLSIILVFASLSSQLSQLTALSFNRVYSSHSHLSIVFIFPSVHWSHLSPTISPPISPQATNLTLTNLTHRRYDLNGQTTLWRSLDGTISLARDPKMTLWRSSQGRDVWVLMGIDPWVMIRLMLAGILMGRLNILIGGFWSWSACFFWFIGGFWWSCCRLGG